MSRYLFRLEPDRPARDLSEIFRLRSGSDLKIVISFCCTSEPEDTGSCGSPLFDFFRYHTRPGIRRRACQVYNLYYSGRTTKTSRPQGEGRQSVYRVLKCLGVYFLTGHVGGLLRRSVYLSGSSSSARASPCLGLELLESARSIGRTPCRAILTCFTRLSLYSYKWALNPCGHLGNPCYQFRKSWAGGVTLAQHSGTARNRGGQDRSRLFLKVPTHLLLVALALKIDRQAESGWIIMVCQTHQEGKIKCNI